MRRFVVWVGISSPEKPAASIFKTEVFSTLKMEAAGSSETLVPTYNRHQIPEKCSVIILNKPYIERAGIMQSA
jgi:hypothetical protein